MNQLILPFSLLLPVFCYVEAQDFPESTDFPDSPIKGSSSVANTVAAVVILTLMFFLVLFLVCMACRDGFCACPNNLMFFLPRVRRLCRHRWIRRHGNRAAQNNQQTPEVLETPNPRSSGVDRIVIESLPFFKFSSLRGLRGGLQCAVCLSKFEDVEVLRLLPKCKHAFHINCVDKWLENHSSCPLCRQRISVEDLTWRNSSRLLSSLSEVREDSNMELFVQREDSRRQQGSSRFRIGSSFRIFGEGVVKEDELPIREDCEGIEENDQILHISKSNPRIIMSNSVFKSRWSDLSSADLLVLSSEMLADVSSNRFPLFDSNTQENSTEEGGISKISRNGMGLKRDFKTMVDRLNQNDSYPLSSGANASNPTRNLLPNEKRSLSEIVVHSRFEKMNMRSNSIRESSVPENAVKEERLRRLWLPIARKTVQLYGYREKKYRPSNYTRQSLNV